MRKKLQTKMFSGTDLSELKKLVNGALDTICPSFFVSLEHGVAMNNYGPIYTCVILYIVEVPVKGDTHG